MTKSGIFPRNASVYRALKLKLKSWPKKRQIEIARAMSDGVELILTRSKTFYLTGGALNVQTGRLRSSVTKTPVFRKGNTFIIRYGTNVFYGAIWEKGLRRKPKVGKARRAFLAPAMADEKSNVRRLLRKAGVDFR